jgi:hypothetical protein
MRTANRQLLQSERCPYLGLHDDPGTALAYPSDWNYCFHAKPPASILAAYQINVCLTTNYSSCAIVTTNKWRRLPRSLHGKSDKLFHRSDLSRRLPGLALFVLVIVILLLALFLGQNPLF